MIIAAAGWLLELLDDSSGSRKIKLPAQRQSHVGWLAENEKDFLIHL